MYTRKDWITVPFGRCLYFEPLPRRCHMRDKSHRRFFYLLVCSRLQRPQLFGRHRRVLPRYAPAFILWIFFLINYDLGSPCEHNGICVNIPGSFACNCSQGFTGPRCETNINECESHPCQNEGSCLDDPGTFRCVCMPGEFGFFWVLRLYFTNTFKPLQTQASPEPNVKLILTNAQLHRAWTAAHAMTT